MLLITLLLFSEPILAFSPYVCPRQMSEGVPFEIFGGPLFPVAVLFSYEDEIAEPFWSSLNGSFHTHLLRAATNTRLRDCLLMHFPSCKARMRASFKKKLNELFPFAFPPSISKHLANKVLESDWTSEASGPLLTLQRRTLIIQCLFWCHTMLSMPPEKRPMMANICPNPCRSEAVCNGVGEIKGTCEMTGEGFFDYQFRCKCKVGFAWNPTLRSCAPDNPCERTESPACNPDGTLSCSFDEELNVSTLFYANSIECTT